MNTLDHIDKAHDIYLARIERLGLSYFGNTLKPFLIKHNMVFYAGMGGFTVCTRGKNRNIELADIKKFAPIHDILSKPVPGTNNLFAEFMPDYTERLPNNIMQANTRGAE